MSRSLCTSRRPARKGWCAPTPEVPVGRRPKCAVRPLFAVGDARRHAEDQRIESSAIESFPKIARIRSRPASFLRSGSASSMNVRYADLSCCFASASARTPRSAKSTSARLMVTCRSLATRRTSAANDAGIVTLCRTDLDDAVLLRVAMVSAYQHCTSVVYMGQGQAGT